MQSQRYTNVNTLKTLPNFEQCHNLQTASHKLTISANSRELNVNSNSPLPIDAFHHWKQILNCYISACNLDCALIPHNTPDDCKNFHFEIFFILTAIKESATAKQAAVTSLLLYFSNHMHQCTRIQMAWIIYQVMRNVLWVSINGSWLFAGDNGKWRCQNRGMIRKSVRSLNLNKCPYAWGQPVFQSTPFPTKMQILLSFTPA